MKILLYSLNNDNNIYFTPENTDLLTFSENTDSLAYL